MNNANKGNLILSEKIAKILNAILNAPQLNRPTVRTIYNITHLSANIDPKKSRYSYTYTDYDREIITLRMHIHVMNTFVRVTLITTDMFEVSDIPNDTWEYICWLLEDKAYEESNRLEDIEVELLAEQEKEDDDKDKKLINKLEKQLELVVWEEQ